MRRSSVFVKKILPSAKISITINPDITNNSLAHPEKTVDNETLQASTRSSHNGRGQAKVQTKLTCAVSQEECILNMCEISYEVNISKFLFKFGRIIHILFTITPA